MYSLSDLMYRRHTAMGGLFHAQPTEWIMHQTIHVVIVDLLMKISSNNAFIFKSGDEILTYNTNNDTVLCI